MDATTKVAMLPASPPAVDDPAWLAVICDGLLVLLTEDVAVNGRWRHVSFSRRSKLPTWADLKRVRYAYFDADATVVQLFPEKENYVSLHDYTLHLWQWLDGEFPFPEARLLGATIGHVPVALEREP